MLYGCWPQLYAIYDCQFREPHCRFTEMFSTSSQNITRIISSLLIRATSGIPANGINTLSSYMTYPLPLPNWPHYENVSGFKRFFNKSYIGQIPTMGRNLVLNISEQSNLFTVTTCSSRFLKKNSLITPPDHITTNSQCGRCGQPQLLRTSRN